MQSEPSRDEKINPETQETLDSLSSPIVKALEDQGFTLGDYIKALVKLSKAKNRRLQKMKHSDFVVERPGKGKDDEVKAIPTEIKLKRGVHVKAQTCDEVLVEVVQDDHDTRISALNLIGKATGWVDADAMRLQTPDPLTLIIGKPEQGVKVQPDDMGEKK